MNTEHTPGPWRVGNGSFVISSHPAPGIIGSDDVQHYGGHLICESVSQANARLIAAAPDLLEVLKAIEGCNVWLPFGLLAQTRAAIAKAEGKA